MEEQDLREIGISDPQHRRKLLQAARALPKVTTQALQPGPPYTSWLGACGPRGVLPSSQGPEGNRGPRSQRSARD